MQNTVKIVAQKEGVPLHLEEAEIKDTSKIQIDWLIDIKELDAIESDNKSAAIENVSIILFSE